MIKIQVAGLAFGMEYVILNERMKRNKNWTGR
jgi:hypothetical protein